MNNPIRCWSIVLCGVLLCSSAWGDALEQEYYAILVDGHKIGYAVHTREVTGKQVRTSEEMNMTMSRAGVAMEIGTKEVAIETVDGKPLGFELETLMNNMGQTIKGKVNGNTMQVTMTVMGSSQTSEQEYPAGAVMAEGLKLLQEKNGLKEGATGSAKLFTPSAMMAVDISWQVQGREKVDLFGRVVELTKVISQIQAPTGGVNSVSYVNENLMAEKVMIQMMGMNLELVACEESIARGANEIVDFFTKLTVASPETLTNEDLKGPLTYIIKPKEDMVLNIPNDDNQKVTSGTQGLMRVDVKPFRAAKGIAIPYSGNDAVLQKAIQPSRHLQSDSNEVRELAKRAIGESKDSAEAGRKVESFVAGYIRAKNLSVGYATAAEVAASREGDCSEHAVLAAAMCRAAGIPARVVTGLVYADEFAGQMNVFGGHAWAEVWVGSGWMALDATRYPRGFGSGHIALARGDGEPADFFNIINTLGYFEIVKIQKPAP